MQKFIINNFFNTVINISKPFFFYVELVCALSVCMCVFVCETRLFSQLHLTAEVVTQLFSICNCMVVWNTAHSSVRTTLTFNATKHSKWVRLHRVRLRRQRLSSYLETKTKKMRMNVHFSCNSNNASTGRIAFSIHNLQWLHSNDVNKSKTKNIKIDRVWLRRQFSTTRHWFRTSYVVRCVVSKSISGTTNVNMVRSTTHQYHCIHGAFDVGTLAFQPFFSFRFTFYSEVKETTLGD